MNFLKNMERIYQGFFKISGKFSEKFEIVFVNNSED